MTPMSSSLAIEPSMEKTPPVAMTTCRAPAPRRRKLGLQIGHVAVGEAETLRLAKPHPVDDRGVVQRIGDDRVLLAEQGFEHPAVGVECGRIEDGVLEAEPVGHSPFEVLVQSLGGLQMKRIEATPAPNAVVGPLGGGGYLSVAGGQA